MEALTACLAWQYDTRGTMAPSHDMVFQLQHNWKWSPLASKVTRTKRNRSVVHQQPVDGLTVMMSNSGRLYMRTWITGGLKPWPLDDEVVPNTSTPVSCWTTDEQPNHYLQGWIMGASWVGGTSKFTRSRLCKCATGGKMMMLQPSYLSHS